MPYMYKKEIDVVTAMYSKLCDLPIELMRPALKTAKIIGAAQKAKIDKMSDRDAAMYILDEVITKSLQVDIPDKFDTFVKVLIEFDDDDTAVALGRQLMGRLPPDSQARIQQKLSGYPGSNPAGYPPQQPGYPPQQPGYQQPGYPGYPNPAGFPPQPPSYPGYDQWSGYPPGVGYPPMPAPPIEVEKFLKGSGNLGTSQYAADDPKTNAVCRIKHGKMLGTGWVAKVTLEGRSVTVLLTNNHVLGNLEIARSPDTEYQFAYVYSNSEKNPVVIYGDKLVPDNPKGFRTCHQQDQRGGILLDYTLVEVYDRPLIDTKAVSGLDGQTRSIYDCRFDLDNIATPASTTTAETITVHHHPKGETLKKSSQESLSVGYLLCYWCDTDGGSSGAPVVKVEGKEPRVIALHRGSWSKGVDVNFGTLITTILDHVKGQTFKVMTFDVLYNQLIRSVKPLIS